MIYRATNSAQTAVFSAGIAASKQRLEVAQERISTGKRINHPSEDPFGAGAVIRLRTTQASVQQFKQNAAMVRDGLQSADGAMDSYERLVDRARTLLTQGSSDLTSPTAKASIAQEIEGLRLQMIKIANTKSDDRFVFGGTRQDAAPYDSTGSPALSATTTQMVQIEPDAGPIAAGVVANTVFANSSGTVFEAMATAAAALRGTGDPVADNAAVLASMDSLTTFGNQAQNGRAQLGASFNTIDGVLSRLESQSLSNQEAVNRYESADFAEAAIALTQATTALQATLQATALASKGSLMDLIA